MDVLESALFLGFKVDQTLQERLDTANPHVKSLFINNNSEYLHELRMEGEYFLGKRLRGPADLQQCELLEANILSLLRKVLPDYSGGDQDLLIVPILHS